MKIKVTVKTGSKTPGVISGEDGVCIVAVKSRAKEGKANAEMIKLLADHFGVIRASVRIISGLKSRKKILEIITN